MTQRCSLIAMGANVSQEGQEPSSALDKAVAALQARGIRIEKASSRYATPCFPPGAGPDFVNAALSVSTDLSPAALLERLHEIEAEMGRERTLRWGPRVIDLDLIAAGDAVYPDASTWAKWAELSPELQTERAPSGLILPHPRLQDRAFVLVPVAEIAPDWVHPILNRSARELRDALPDAERTAIRRLPSGE